MGKTVKIRQGGGSVKSTQPFPKGGGVRKGKIGTKGPVRSGSTAGAGGAGWSHMPSPNSYGNAGSKGRVHTPAKKVKPRQGGPKWGHLPERPGVS